MAKTKPIIKDIDEVFCSTFKPYTKIIKVVDGSPNTITDRIRVVVEILGTAATDTIKFSGEDFVDISFLAYKNGEPFGGVFTWESINRQFSNEYLLSDLEFGKHEFTVNIVNRNDITSLIPTNPLAGSFEFEILAANEATTVRLARPGFDDTQDKELWSAIKDHTVNFRTYSSFIERIMCRDDFSVKDSGGETFSHGKRRHAKDRSPFIGAREYNLLKFGTEFYMLAQSALSKDDIKNYLGNHQFLPYYEHISDSLDDVQGEYQVGECLDVKEFRLNNPFFIELIWSYWMEQGMLMQAMNLITLRFQNIDNGNLGQLARFDLSPLRTLSQLLWGFIQDEQHRLSLPRRLREYDHEYGLNLTGKAVPAYVSADPRSKFLEAYHNLLTTCAIFYKEADDTTRIADAFPILNSLKEIHLLLAEGNHNAYGNLTWTARQEMMMTQYIISREETRIFLGGRPMVPYPENWMDRLDTVRGMMGWGNTSITYFYDLAIHGEKILLGIRYGNWSDSNMPVAGAANWAMAFRDSVQKYIHAYRTVTGVDLSADGDTSATVKFIQPSVLIQRRIAEGRRLRRA